MPVRRASSDAAPRRKWPSRLMEHGGTRLAAFDTRQRCHSRVMAPEAGRFCFFRARQARRDRMTRRLAGRLIGALLMAVFVTAASAPAYGQASAAPPPVDATPQSSGSTPENSNTVPEDSKGQEKPRMQWEEQTLFAFRRLCASGA